jgi:hypothetical protein
MQQEAAFFGAASSFQPVDEAGQSNAAPTMIFRINNHRDPCERLKFPPRF